MEGRGRRRWSEMGGGKGSEGKWPVKEEEKDQRGQEGQTAGRADSGCQSRSWRRETTSGSGGELKKKTKKKTARWFV